MPDVGDIRIVDYGRRGEVWDGNEWLVVEELDPRHAFSAMRRQRFDEKARKLLLSRKKLMVKDLMDDLETGDRKEEVMNEKIKQEIPQTSDWQQRAMPLMGSITASVLWKQ